MITSVQISNINAIDKCKIDFKKGRYSYLNEMVYNDVSVNPIAFYGTNGSGKSSFLRAFEQLVCILIYEPDRIKGFTPHQGNMLTQMNKMSSENKQLPKEEVINGFDSIKSSIDVEFILNNKEYSYFIETSLAQRITREKLAVGENVVFARTDNNYRYKNKSFNLDSKMYPVIRKLANDEQIGDKDIDSAFNYLSNMTHVDNQQRVYSIKAIVEKKYPDIIVDKSKQVKEILSKYEEFPLYKISSIPNVNGGNDYFADIDLKNGKELRIPYFMLSEGMKTQSALLSFVLSLPENSTMFIDEIEVALHPLTILDFINVVKEKHIQLFFSSHNTFILQKLRPDQIIFANWDSENGYSTYKKLSDIYPNIREVNNIEKMYLSNLFDEDIKDECKEK